MANYYGTSRTNYFKVDPAKREAFDAWMAHFKLEKTESEEGIALFPSGWTDDGTFPTYDSALDDRDPESRGEIDFAQELAKFLAPGSVAILMEAGAEKQRYVHGHAIAVDCTGREIGMSLFDIYDRASAEFPGAEITRAEY